MEELTVNCDFVCVGKSTDEELLDLMLELAQTPVAMGTQSSQSVYQTPSVAHSLSRRLRTTLSTPTISTTGSRENFTHSQSVCDTHRKTSFIETSLTASQPVLKAGPTIAVEEKDDVMQSNDEVDKFLVPLLNKSEGISQTNITTESETGSSAQVGRANCSAPSPLLLTPPQIVLDSSFPSPKSPLVFSDNNLFDNDFPLDPPLTLSPPRVLEGNMEDTHRNQDFDLTLEGENTPSKNLSVMLNSSSIDSHHANGDDVEDSRIFDSEFDIPCAQPLSSPKTPVETQPSQHKTRSSSRSSGSPDRSQTVSSNGGKMSEDVQLEFEMPEISLSQFEAFQNTTAEILGTPSKMGGARERSHDMVHSNYQMSTSQPEIGGRGENAVSGLGQERGMLLCQYGVKEEITPVEKRTSAPYRNEGRPSDEREVEDLETSSRTSQNCLSSSQRRRLLLQLCSGDTEDLVNGDDEERGDVGVCESDTEAEEEEWRSGQWSVAPDNTPGRLKLFCP